VAATDHRHALALEQGAVAVRAIGHALVAVLVLAGHADLPPARTGGQHHGAAADRSAAFEFDGGDAPGILRQRLATLQVHDVDVVLAHVRLELRRHPRPIGFLDRDEVLDRHGVEHLAPETLGDHAGADAL